MYNYEEEIYLDDIEEINMPDHIEWDNHQSEDFTLEALDVSEW
jgi:hypothetical protein